MSSYDYCGLAAYCGCAGCADFRRTEVGPPDKERQRCYCISRRRVGCIEGPKPDCWHEADEKGRV